MSYYGTFTADGDTDPFHAADEVTIVVDGAGTWGSGTVKVFVRSEDHDAWLQLLPVITSAENTKNIRIPGRYQYKLNMSGATSPNLKWQAFEKRPR